MNQTTSLTAAHDLFSSFYRTQLIRYGVSGAWGLGLAIVVGGQIAVVWLGLTFALGLLRTGIELRRITGGAQAYDLSYLAASVISNCGWAAAPVIAWRLGGGGGKELAIAYLACGTIMVFSQMRGSFGRSLALCGPYAVAALALLAQAIGQGQGAGVAFSLLAIVLGLVTQTVLSHGQDRIVSAYQREQAMLIGDLQSERRALQGELERRTRAEAKVGELIVLAQQTMHSKSSLIQSIERDIGIERSEPVEEAAHAPGCAGDLDELVGRLSNLVVSIRARDNTLERTIEALSRARRAAEAASHAKTQFLMVASHELRTPLNAIINYAELALEDLHTLDAEALARGDIERNLAAARHLLGLIDAILEYASLEGEANSSPQAPVDPMGLTQSLRSCPRAWCMS